MIIPSHYGIFYTSSGLSVSNTVSGEDVDSVISVFWICDVAGLTVVKAESFRWVNVVSISVSVAGETAKDQPSFRLNRIVFPIPPILVHTTVKASSQTYSSYNAKNTNHILYGVIINIKFTNLNINKT